jgi:hypothetical protein
VNVLAADGEEAESNDAVGQASLPNEPIAKLHSGFAHWPLTELQPGPVELRAIDFYRTTTLETQHHHVSSSQHVRSFPRPLHPQTAMVEAVDDALRQLVRQLSWLQIIGSVLHERTYESNPILIPSARPAS